MQDIVKVNIYGDSIMRGTVIDESLRYHSTIAEWLRKLAGYFGMQFKNRSHFGITIQKGNHLLQKDTENGLDCEYAVVEFGGNDCSFAWNEVAQNPTKDHRPFTEVDVFANTCEDMVTQIKQTGAKPVLVTLPPLDAQRHLNFIGKTEAERRNILQWLGDVNMIYRFHELYSNTIARIAKETESILVDVRSRFLDKHNHSELVGIDGVHLSPAGYQLFAQTFAEFIEAKRQNQNLLLFT